MVNKLTRIHYLSSATEVKISNGTITGYTQRYRSNENIKKSQTYCFPAMMMKMMMMTAYCLNTKPIKNTIGMKFRDFLPNQQRLFFLKYYEDQ